MKEFILCSALNFKGDIIPGMRHSNCYELLQNLLPDLEDEQLPGRDNQGFLTSENRFVNRKEAWKIAKENNQIKYGLESSDELLISENLY